MIQKLLDWHSSRRLTLSDLTLKPNQLAILKGTSSEYRQALYDAGEMICLTELDEKSRQAIIKYRKYLMGLTKNPTNEIQSDRTIVDDINDRRAKFFKPRT